MVLGGTGDITVSGTQDDWVTLLQDFQFQDLETKGVHLIEVTDNGHLLALSVAQAVEYAGTTLKMADGDTFGILDYENAVSGITEDFIKQFHDRGITDLNVSKSTNEADAEIDWGWAKAKAFAYSGASLANRGPHPHQHPRERFRGCLRSRSPETRYRCPLRARDQRYGRQVHDQRRTICGVGHEGLLGRREHRHALR